MKLKLLLSLNMLIEYYKNSYLSVFKCVVSTSVVSNLIFKDLGRCGVDCIYNILVFVLKG